MGLVLVCACDDVLWASFQDRFEKFGSVLKPSESVSSLFTAYPRDSQMGARRTSGAPSRSSIGWSCRKCSTLFSTPSTSGGALGDRRALSPTAMLEQMKERLYNIAQDMYIMNRSCWEEIVCSSLARARRAALKKRRWPVKQACSDMLGSVKYHTQLHHTHHVQHFLPPSRHHLPFQPAPLTAQSFTNVTPILGLFSTLEANKTSISDELIRPAPAPALLTKGLVSEKRRIQDLPHTPETGR